MSRHSKRVVVSPPSEELSTATVPDESATADPSHTNHTRNKNHGPASSSTSSSSLSVPTSSASRPRASSFGFVDEVDHTVYSSPPPASPIYRALCCQSGRGPLSWTGLGIVCSAMAVGSLGFHLLLDTIGDQLILIDHGSWYTLIGTIGILLIMIAVPLTHGLVGVRRYGPRLYTFFQPFVGGIRFVVLQVLAWTIWTVTVLAGIYLIFVGGKKLTSGWLSAVGVGGVVSQLLVLISLHFFVSNASTKQIDQVAALKAERVRAHRAKVREQKKKRTHEAKKKANWQQVKDETEEEEEITVPSPPHPSPAASTSMWPWSSLAMKLTFAIIATLSLLLALFVESIGTNSPSRTVSLQSLLTSAILLAVPITHLLARRSLTHAGYLLFQPFKGGARFVVLQAIAWTLWTLAFVSAGGSFIIVAMKQGGSTSDITAGLVPPVDSNSIPATVAVALPWPWLSNLITSAGIGGILSQALVLISLTYFDSKLSHKIGTTARVIEMVRRGSEPNLLNIAQANRAISEDVTKTPTDVLDKEVLDRAVRVLSSPRHLQSQLLVSPRASARALATPRNDRVSPEVISSEIPRPSASPASRAHASVDEDEDEEDSPVLTAPFGEAMATDGTPLEIGGYPITTSPESPTTLTRVPWKDLTQTIWLTYHYYRLTEWKPLLKEKLLDFRALLVIGILYMIPILGAIMTFVPWIMMYTMYPLPWYFYTIYGTGFILYMSTYRNRPSLTGSRSWPAVRQNEMLWSSMERYFNGLVIPLGQLSDSQGPYIFGFHPHGIYPMTCFWATRGAQFQKAYPGLHIDVCGASIMFYAPFLREIVMWTGGREVSGTSIRLALKQKRSIMLVPGGQREMRHSAADPSFLTLVTRHRGFIRMALEHGTPLVPVLSLGETMLLENVHAPRMQAYTLRTVGVGFPIWPYGRWYSPLPNPHPVVVIFGHPITVPLNKDPSPELIEEIHQVYYKQLQQMFNDHRQSIPGFEHCKLIFSEE